MQTEWLGGSAYQAQHGRRKVIHHAHHLLHLGFNHVQHQIVFNEVALSRSQIPCLLLVLKVLAYFEGSWWVSSEVGWNIVSFGLGHLVLFQKNCSRRTLLNLWGRTRFCSALNYFIIGFFLSAVVDFFFFFASLQHLILQLIIVLSVFKTGRYRTVKGLLEMI